MAKDRFSFESVEKAVRKKTFGILTTIDSKGRPHSTGIIYGVSPHGVHQNNTRTHHILPWSWIWIYGDAWKPFKPCVGNSCKKLGQS